MDGRSVEVPVEGEPPSACAANSTRQLVRCVCGAGRSLEPEAADPHRVRPPHKTQRDCFLQAAQGVAAGGCCAESLGRCTSAILTWTLATESADRSVQVGSRQTAAAVGRICTHNSHMPLQAYSQRKATPGLSQPRTSAHT